MHTLISSITQNTLRTYYLIFTLGIFQSLSWAQFTDDFSDSDFSANPAWSGDVAKFTIDNEELRSNSNDVSDLFYLSTPSSASIGDIEWRFRVNMKFSTSGANYTDVFLMSDSANLKAVTNGYFLRIGNTRDEISLYKIVNGTVTQLTDGSDSKTQNKNISVKVTKGAFGTWSISADYAGGTSYEAEGTAIDNDIITSSYFGFLIRQSTTSFHLKHYYDDIYVGPIVLDTKKPEILNIQITDANTILLIASKNVDTFGTSFLLDNGYGSPDNVEVNNSEITLTYTTELVNDSYTLAITQLSDLSGNQLDTSISFNYLKGISPEEGDLIITEIMSDPSPPASLPEVEYLEIYNNSLLPIELEGCTIDDGGSPAALPSFILKSNEYLLICKEGTEGLFSSVANVIATDLPALNNSGDIITLRNGSNELIDRVSYTDKLYGDDLKKQGGYSLEKIDLISDCNEEINWTASDNNAGGTPGAANSVNGLSQDTEAPLILSATIENDTTVLLSLDENAVNQTLLNTDNYELTTSSIDIKNVNYDATTYRIILILSSPITPNEAYELEVKNLADCRGNSKSNITTQLIATSAPQVGDLIINELLFNPKQDGVDFIELYNKSENFIRLEDLSLARYTDTIENEYQITSPVILYPNEYVVISTDTSATRVDYPNAQNQVQLDNLPPMNNDEGTILLRNTNATLDSVLYSDDQHFELLTSTDGVSLERISFRGQSYSPFLWHSASSSAGYATPGYQNSQFQNTEVNNTTFALQAKLFSPDGDGYQDQLILNYALEQTGTVLNAYIFALNGQRINQVINNEMLSTSGILAWDGILSNGSKLSVGNYIILLEYFDLNGTTGKKKLAFSVLGNF